MRKIQMQVRSFLWQERSLPNETPKTDPLFSTQYQRILYTTYYNKEWNPQNKL